MVLSGLDGGVSFLTKEVASWDNELGPRALDLQERTKSPLSHLDPSGAEKKNFSQKIYTPSTAMTTSFPRLFEKKNQT